jgi:hypothetical protein
MCVNKWSAITLGTACAFLVVPVGALGADAAAGAPGITLTLNRVIGAQAVNVSGTAPAARPLEAAVYARFSRDLPTVLLSRRSISTGADGHFAAVVTIAPAYFRGAIVTIVVRPLPFGPSAMGEVIVTEPNAPAPPDELPPSVR